MRFLLLLLLSLPLWCQPVLDKSWQTLDRGLHDNNPAKRVQAVTAMGVMRPHPKSVAMVESAFADKDYSVRQSACSVLGQMKSRQSIPKLRDALNDPAPEVVFAAAKALYDMGDPTGRSVLIAVLLGDQADSSNFFKSSMHDMRAKMHDTKGLLLISVKEGAGAFLGPAGAGIGVAEGLMKDANASGKTVAAALLANDRNPEAVNAIREALGDKNWTVRAAAARALALAGSTRDFDTIASLLDDKKEEVQYSAAAALIRLRQPLYAPRTAPAKGAPSKPAAATVAPGKK
ncbi:MAG TPA: HEAT repeat domain-containing protein [Bryobacteraceae bacterium]|jgi:HEAT repeat protein